MPASREFRPPPSATQKEVQLTALCSAIDVICGAWESALEALDARGWTSGERVSGGAISDPTGSAALNGDVADKWLHDCKRNLGLLLGLSCGNGGLRWRGPFVPPRLQSVLKRAAEDVIDIWPVNVALLIERIHRLANTARAEWPPQVHFGQIVDGIKVGEHLNQVEMCQHCGKPVAGGQADPIVRIDGRPYHRTPCYNTVWQQQKRRVNQAEIREQAS